MNPSILNVHTHCFTLGHVPRHFFPGQGLLARTERGRKLLSRSLRVLSRFHPEGRMERSALFLQRGNHPDQLSILEILAGYYPRNTRFVVHSLDFDFMGAGQPLPGHDFISQIEELARIKQDPAWKDRIFPFFCVDPRRAGVADLVKEYILHKGFAGIKLYPALGFYPFDPVLSPVWSWAAREGIPTMVHCSRSGPVYGRTLPPPSARIHPLTGEPLGARRKRIYADYYTHPLNWEPLLQEYPGLKVCFAHFGGDRDCMAFYKEGNRLRDNWFEHIVNLLKTYEGAYADISFASANPDLMALFHVYAQHRPEPTAVSCLPREYALADKILFGSDFYMSQLRRNERWFSINVRSLTGEETFRRMSETNPEKFLFGE